MGSTKRTTVRLSDERQLLIEKAKEIIAEGQTDDPPTSDMIDAALTHLIESKDHFEDSRHDLSPTVIKRFNTSVLGLRYRTAIRSD